MAGYPKTVLELVDHGAHGLVAEISLNDPAGSNTSWGCGRPHEMLWSREGRRLGNDGVRCLPNEQWRNAGAGGGLFHRTHRETGSGRGVGVEFGGPGKDVGYL